MEEKMQNKNVTRKKKSLKEEEEIYRSCKRRRIKRRKGRKRIKKNEKVSRKRDYTKAENKNR